MNLRTPATAPETTVRLATVADAEAVVRIYNHYISNTIVTFEEEPLAAAEMAQRIEHVLGATMPWLVAERGSQVVGYAYASTWEPRRGYRFSTEITVYLDPTQTGGGIGSKLYERLFAILKEQGLHVVIGGIALPNAASVALHEKFGLEKVAHFRDVGTKFGQWIDVGYWQRIL